MQVGDLVKMKRGYSTIGVVAKVLETPFLAEDIVTVIWSDGKSRETGTDLKVLNESR